MSRFTPSGNNLCIAVDDSSAEVYALAAAEALRKGGARKVYFRGVDGQDYPALVQLGQRGITLVLSGQEPSNFLTSSRVLHQDGELVIVSDKPMRKEQWWEVAESIEAEVARDSNAG
jgi:hypothetical protein